VESGTKIGLATGVTIAGMNVHIRWSQVYAGRRTKFATVKSLDSSEFSSEFSDLKTL